MTFGQKLQRQQMVSQMRFSGKSKDFSGEMDLVNAKVAEFEFAQCIVDHNLEDESGNKLDFKKPRDVNRLDPRIGDEIGELIGKMNNFDRDADEDDEEQFPESDEDVSVPETGSGPVQPA
jgi:hypothetical protein